MQNTLCYGDNLAVLRHHVRDASVDLAYLDPPFNSSQDYNLLFRGVDGGEAPAQVQAFRDTWRFDARSNRELEELVQRGDRVGDLMHSFRALLDANGMMAYLTMMAPRLLEVRRALKPAGSVYLHCDPTASHYLKLLMDAVFGAENFRNEIVWKR